MIYSNTTDTKVSYSGIEGSFAAIAVAHIFPECTAISCRNFTEAYESVARGITDACVLPIENSYAGEVGHVMDLLFSGNLKIRAIHELRINQCLLGIPGTRMDTLTAVISHPQALEQCSEFIHDHGLTTIQSENTARAARLVAEQGDPTLAAIASAETADLYGLEILMENINTGDENTTRFAVLTRDEDMYAAGPAEGGAFVLMFTVPDEVGALVKAIAVISSYGFNMRVIRSRPMRDKNWHYYFYAELVGDVRSDRATRMLSTLSDFCDMFKVVGEYKAE